MMHVTRFQTSKRQTRTRETHCLASVLLMRATLLLLAAHAAGLAALCVADSPEQTIAKAIDLQSHLSLAELRVENIKLRTINEGQTSELDEFRAENIALRTINEGQASELDARCISSGKRRVAYDQ